MAARATKARPRGRPFEKGHKSKGGRPPGSLTRHTVEVKDAIALAFNQIGGQEAFAKWAMTHRDLFYQNIWAKLLPVKLTVDQTLRLETVIEVRNELIQRGIPVDRVEQLFEVPQIPDEPIQIEHQANGASSNGKDHA
jgi:hypothetical protein